MNKQKVNSILNLCIAFLLLFILVMGIVGVNCYIEQYEKICQMNKLVDSLEDAVNKGEKLRIEYEKRTNIREVEDYAVNVLGLQKYSSYQVEYITNSNVNKTVFYNEELPQESILTRVAAVFSIITEYFN